MKKFNMDKSTLIGLAAAICGGAASILKMVDDKNKKESEKKEMIAEIMEQLQNKN